MWKGESAYNPWTHISHKELIYLLQKSTCPQSKVLLRILLGEGLVGVNHRTILTSTHKEDNKKIMLRLHHITVHHTCMLRESQTLTQVFLPIQQLLTSMTLISPSLYLKTIIRNQTSLRIQCTLYESFYYIPLGCPSY